VILTPVIRHIAGWVLIAAVIFQASFFTLPQSTAAQAPGVGNVPSFDLWNNLVTYVKDTALKQVALNIVGGILKRLTQSIVDWIENGFEGSPSFVEDPAGFFVNIADEEIGEFLFGSELGFLCQPFQLQIRLGINFNRRRSFRRNSRCTISDIIRNVDNFTQDVQNWDQFIAISGNPANNPTGAYALANGELDARISGRRASLTAELNFGSGFLSWRKCKRYETQGGGSPVTGAVTTTSGGITASGAVTPASVRPKCAEYGGIETPGSVIVGQLNSRLAADANQIGLADDINEIVGALMNQVVTQIFKAGGSLLGSGSRSRGSQLADVDTTTAQLLAVRDNAQTALENRSENTSAAFGNAVNRQNLSLRQPARQSSTYGASTANFAVNGNTDGSFSGYNQVAIAGASTLPWWEVELSATGPYFVEEVKVWRRTNDSAVNTLGVIEVVLYNKDASGALQVVSRTGRVTVAEDTPVPLTISVNQAGQYLRIERVDQGNRYLQLAEVEVYGYATSTRPTNTGQTFNSIPGAQIQGTEANPINLQPTP
jgi:hypothetical protein